MPSAGPTAVAVSSGQAALAGPDFRRMPTLKTENCVEHFVICLGLFLPCVGYIRPLVPVLLDFCPLC